MASLIDSNLIETFLKSHGILLEHQTKDRLESYFDQKGKIRTSEVGKLASIPSIDDPFEIDGYFEIEQLSSTVEISYLDRITQINGERSYQEKVKVFHNQKLINVFTVECKGHPSDGFLLCRTGNNTSIIKSSLARHNLFFDDGSKEGWFDDKNSHFTDWLQFCVKKQKNSKYEYQEDKGKAQKAIFQTNQNILFMIERASVIFKEFPYPLPSPIIRLVPLIVTNAPICSMKIDETGVEFTIVPWITYVNSDEFPKRHGKKSDFFKFIYVVQFQHISDFFNKFFSLETGNIDGISVPASPANFVF